MKYALDTLPSLRIQPELCSSQSQFVQYFQKKTFLNQHILFSLIS